MAQAAGRARSRAPDGDSLVGQSPFAPARAALPQRPLTASPSTSLATRSRSSLSLEELADEDAASFFDGASFLASPPLPFFARAATDGRAGARPLPQR